MFFNWYTSNWWFNKDSSCSAQAKSLETVVETSIIFDHYPKIEEHRKNDSNIGNIVSNLWCKILVVKNIEILPFSYSS